MAKFQFNCPQCGQTVKADETWSGRDGECPCCGKAIVVPCNHVHSDIVRKGGEGKQILTRAKSAVIIDNCQDDRERERNDSSFASGFSGGFKAASTLSQFDSGGDDGFGAGTYLLAGLIGGLVETSNNDTRINEKYKRIVQEYREQEEGLYIGFRQDINKLRSSETFNAFDKVRLLFDDAISVVKNVDSDKARQLVQCKVPELALAASSQLISMEHPDETKKNIVDCIANYPQSLASPRKPDVSACYSFLATVRFARRLRKVFATSRNLKRTRIL